MTVRKNSVPTVHWSAEKRKGVATPKKQLFRMWRKNVGATRHFLQSTMWRKQGRVTPPRGVHFWQQLMVSKASSPVGNSKKIFSSGCKMANTIIALQNLTKTCSDKRMGLKAVGRSYKREDFSFKSLWPHSEMEVLRPLPDAKQIGDLRASVSLQKLKSYSML